MIYRFVYVRALTRTPQEGRLSFFYTAAARDGQPLLALTRLDRDPVLADLNEIIRDVRPAPGALSFSGTADVGPTGAIRFFVPTDGAALLAALAELVRAQLEEIPDLLRLAGAQVIEEGAPAQLHQDDALWEGLLPSSLPASAVVQRYPVGEVLSALEPSARLLFWLATKGPGRIPALTLVSDPETHGGERLQQRIRALQLSGASGQTARGIVHIAANEKGRKHLVFSTPDDCPKLLPALGRFVQAHLSAEPALKKLRGAVHVQLDADGKVTKTHADDAMWQAIFS